MKKAFALGLVGAAAAASAQPGSFIDLGTIGPAGNYTFDTIGSTDVIGGFNADTEIGLWDAAGTLIDEDDDGGGFPFSLVSAPLTAGVYYLGISEFNSDFENGFTNIGSAFDGNDDMNAVLNVNTVFAGGGVAGASLAQETLFFKVTVTPAPASAALLGLGGLVATRRRRA
ncbi:MAG: DVUA0089 family protein [Phycisphaerales bacterium]|nr:DVUA0089 family protein [Phycisphaerales bacterium]